jgi:hypothetical protein
MFFCSQNLGKFVLAEDLPQRPTGGVILIEGTVSQDFLKQAFSIIIYFGYCYLLNFSKRTLMMQRDCRLSVPYFFNNTDGKQWLRISLIPVARPITTMGQ